MKNCIRIFLSSIYFLTSIICIAQKKDTITITPSNLNLNAIKFGKITYVVYNKKNKESPSQGIYLAKINVESKIYNGKPTIAITQQWDREDTVIHKAYTVLNSTDFSTLLHDTYWRRLGYSSKFDFETKQVSFVGVVTDSVKSKTVKDFNESFARYNLNWHSDLIIFTLLPFKERQVYKINFFDPGFGKSSEEIYSVIKSDILETFSGEKVECWVLEIKFTSSIGYQKFWVRKKNAEVLKEEDFFNNSYRYKLKLDVSE